MKNFIFENYNYTPTSASQKAVALCNRHKFSRKLALIERNSVTSCEPRPKTKIHKHATPINIAYTIKFSIGRKLNAPLPKHDVDQNPYLRADRIKLNMRLNMRTEAEETAKALFTALIKYCEYNIHDEFLFEVKASISQIASEIGLSHNERCDRVNRMLNTFQRAGLLIQINEFDKDLNHQKAARLFLLPDFFYSIGHTPESLKKLLAQLDRHYTKKKQHKSILKRNIAHRERIERANVANLQANDKTKAYFRLLVSIKTDFLNDKVFDKATNYKEKTENKQTQKEHGKNECYQVLFESDDRFDIYETDSPEIRAHKEFVNASISKTPPLP